ncbi:MAG: hypothetical protein IIY55_03685 [Blautia sp.]|nr:hypothetical protein [Blautia sp.]
MKEKLYTIPLNDAMNENDECPFCFLERSLLQRTMDFVLGNSSSYMESDMREKTDKAGFCRTHTKMMFDYGNALGNGLILQTHLHKVRQELHEQLQQYTPSGKGSLFKRISAKNTSGPNPISTWAKERDSSCFICDQLKEEFSCYIATFFFMYKKDEAFRQKVRDCKGFCIPHFGMLMEEAEKEFSGKDLQEFVSLMQKLMEENLERIEEELTWFVDKFDYRNKDADWKNSRDALQRTMQKLHSGYPADPVYQNR